MESWSVHSEACSVQGREGRRGTLLSCYQVMSYVMSWKSDMYVNGELIENLFGWNPELSHGGQASGSDGSEMMDK